MSVTIAELDGELLEIPIDSVKAEQPLLDYHRRGGIFYPLIQVAVDKEQPSKRSKQQQPKTPWLRQSAISGWLGRQVLEALRLYSDGQDVDAAARGKQSPVHAFGWHRYLNRFAVSLKDGSNDFIAIYDLDAEAWLPTVLKHQFQREVTCLAWQPNAGGSLCVGCSRGVCTWRMEPTSDAAHQGGQGGSPAPPDAAWATFWRLKGFDQVSAMCWSPCGRFLAVGYRSSDQCVVWDAATGIGNPLESFVPLSWLGVAAGGVQTVSWAPSGRILVVALEISLFAVYDTTTWSCKRHRTDGPLRSVHFSPNSRYMIGAVSTKQGGEVWSYMLQNSPLGEGIVIAKSKRIEGVEAGAGRPIRGLAWSASGERLAVSFGTAAAQSGGDDGLLLVMLTECHGQTLNVRAVARGCIKGPPHAISSPSTCVGSASHGVPSHLEFRPSFRKCEGRSMRGSEREGGALLSVCWQNGRISNYPLYFSSVDGEQNKPPPLPREWS